MYKILEYSLSDRTSDVLAWFCQRHRNAQSIINVFSVSLNLCDIEPVALHAGPVFGDIVLAVLLRVGGV